MTWRTSGDVPTAARQLRKWLSGRVMSRPGRYRAPRHVHIITRELLPGVRLYWAGQTNAGRERWSHRQADAVPYRHIDAAQAAVRGCNLPKDSLILRVKC